MKFIKKYYLLLLLIITLAGATIYGTYAMFTSSVETNMVNMDTNMVYKFKINGTQELKVSAGSKLRFNAIVENDMDGKISYGMYYKMISPATLPSGVIIAQVSDDLTMLAKGQLESGTSKTVPMVIKNTSDSEITVEIGVRTGYATDSQGPDDIIYNEGEIPITSFQTSAEAGNDSCTATMECTEECESRQINGEWKLFCVCNTGEKGQGPRSSSEMLAYLGLSSNGVKNTVTSTATRNEGIYETTDDYGTTYYFRGAVTNNYVKFANKYWRIIRINGDGSLRLIYDGTSAHANGEISTDRQIGTSAFNSSFNDNAYVGYMYGQTGASSYSAAHANTNNSTIKTVVDNWYKTNIEDKGYSDKVADVIYCNDRKIYTGSSWNGYGTLGYGTNATTYEPASRMLTWTNGSSSWASTQTIKMTCSQKNDAFTVDDTSKGNGALTYPVGLITVDEALAGGGKGGSSNSSYYLYTGNYYWTMSPYYFSGTVAFEFLVRSGGVIYNYNVSRSYGVRPVLSLKSDITLTGTGTQTDPWIVQS